LPPAFVARAVRREDEIAVDANADVAAHGGMRMALFYETRGPRADAGSSARKLAGHLREHASHQPAFSAQ